MSANITPFNSDGGFTTAGNITGGTANLVAINGPSDAFFDIKVTDSGPGASLQLGDWDIAGFPKSLVQVSDNVHIVTGVTTGGGDWNFDTNGDVTVPGDILAQEGNDLAVQVFNPTAEGGVTYVVQNRQVDLDYDRTTQFEVAPANIILSTDVSGNRYQWIFDNTGNLTLPTDSFRVNYANGDPVSISGTYGDSNVVSLMGAFDNNPIGNISSISNIGSINNVGSIEVNGDGSYYIYQNPTGAGASIGMYYNEQQNGFNIDANGVGIYTSDGSYHNWLFGTDAVTTFPGSIQGSEGQTWTIQGGNSVPYQDSPLNIRGSQGNASIDGRDVNIEGGFGNNGGNVNITGGSAIGNILGNVNINSGASIWTFGNTGNTTFPNGAVFTGYDLYAAANSYIELAGSNDNTYVGLDNNSVFIQTDWNNSQKQWTFDSAGNLTLPGNLTLSNGAVIRDTAGNAVAFGLAAGANTQGASAVAIGLDAGQNNQGFISIAIGAGAGANGQGQAAVAIGTDTGANIQGIEAIAIGFKAANQNQGQQSIAIGKRAGYNNQGNNSIILNATGDALDQTTANTFTVAPVRNDNSNVAEVMFYNTASKEITYGNTISVAGNVTGNYFVGNGSQLSGVATQVTGSWDVPVGNSTQSFTVNSGTYSMWVDCSIPNGILVWNATATVTNTNVPVIGQQFAWVYNGGGTPIDFTSIPNQFVGTANAIVRSNTAPSSTTNRFDFGIRNTSGGNVTVRYGYTEL